MFTRLFGLASVLFVTMIALLVVGFTSNAPALLILSVLCVGPVFFLMLGAAIGKASNELVVMRREKVGQSRQTITRVNTRNVPESLG